MQTLDKLFSVNNTLWLDLVDVSFEHCLECGAQSLLRELEFSEDLLHFIDCHASSILCICFLQRVIQL